MRLRSATLTFVALVVALAWSSVECGPMKFMCDMCESNWIHCLIKCNVEEYITRHNYENHVYMGETRVKPKKNQLDRMFEKIMHSTGHDQMKK